LNNPGHFLVRALHPLDSEKDVVLDVFNGGVVVKDLPTNISVATPAEVCVLSLLSAVYWLLTFTLILTPTLTLTLTLISYGLACSGI
jgi:hypothetical protein